MIYDDIKNLGKYEEISPKIVDFIMGLRADIQTGRIYLSDDKLVFANIDEYTTKKHLDCRLEAHKKYIDIQIMLNGIEELDYTDVEGLTVSEQYDEERDVMFFSTPDRALNKVILSAGKFVLLYPHEAHQPQMELGGQHIVKKVVVKIPVGRCSQCRHTLV